MSYDSFSRADMKNWYRSMLLEKYTGDEDPAKLNIGSQAELRKINNKIESKKEGNYSAFVDYLQQNISDPKVHALLYSGLFDGDPNDDKVQVEEVDIAVSSLMPTQSEIGLADSLGWVSENNPAGGAKLAAAGPGHVADVGGRIIAADGRYIIDGHHRWSQVYLLNPQAKIPAYNLIAPDSPVPGKSGTESGQDFLKMSQIAIAAVDGNVPTVEADTATDVYKTGGDRNKIEAVIRDVIPEGSPFASELSAALSGAGKISNKTMSTAGTVDQALSELKIYDALFEGWQEDMADNIKAASTPAGSGAGSLKDQKISSEFHEQNYEGVIDYIVNNAIALYNGTAATAKKMTSRNKMPQFDKGGSDPKTKVDALKTGKIDWNPPYDTSDMGRGTQAELMDTMGPDRMTEAAIKRLIRRAIKKNLY